jgi:hypothetical protein
MTSGGFWRKVTGGRGKKYSTKGCWTGQSDCGASGVPRGGVASVRRRSVRLISIASSVLSSIACLTERPLVSVRPRRRATVTMARPEANPGPLWATGDRPCLWSFDASSAKHCRCLPFQNTRQTETVLRVLPQQLQPVMGGRACHVAQLCAGHRQLRGRDRRSCTRSY